MKITASQLKRIIAEEVEAAMAGASTELPAAPDPQLRVAEFFAAVQGDLAAMFDPAAAARAIEIMKIDITPQRLGRAIDRAVYAVRPMPEMPPRK